MDYHCSRFLLKIAMALRSMTGYGKAQASLAGGSSLTVEIRTLNAKTADISIKSSILPKEMELEIRSKLASRLQRGTIDIYITLEKSASDAASSLLNSDVLGAYLSQVKDFMAKENLPLEENAGAVIASLLRFPDVLDSKKAEVISEEDYPAIDKAFEEAISAVDAFRLKEGKVLEADIRSRIANILSLYDEVETYEPRRIEAVRARLQKNLEDLQQKVDPQRFEQEMVFYLEKLDINEEKVRLRQHCKYFLETVESEMYPGKKLGFIIQEIGREINTTGSKANDSDIQKCVVKMKDELEKMREQSMNIL